MICIQIMSCMHKIVADFPKLLWQLIYIKEEIYCDVDNCEGVRKSWIACVPPDITVSNIRYTQCIAKHVDERVTQITWMEEIVHNHSFDVSYRYPGVTYSCYADRFVWKGMMYVYEYYSVSLLWTWVGNL